MLIATFRENKPSIICCSETLMTEFSATRCLYTGIVCAYGIWTWSNKNEGVAIYAHESLYFELLELSKQTESFPALSYTGVNCTIKIKETFTVVCLYISPSVTKKDFSDQFELLLESLSKIKNYFSIGKINFVLFECFHIANRYLNLLDILGCSQGIEEPTNRNPFSEASFNLSRSYNPQWLPKASGSWSYQDVYYKLFCNLSWNEFVPKNLVKTDRFSETVKPRIFI